MTVMNPANIQHFLRTLAKSRSVVKASRAVGISQSTLYLHRRTNPTFRAAWAEALDRGDELLTQEAMRRVMAGIEHPVFYRGEKIASVRRYSDALLINLLKVQLKRREDRQARESAEKATKDELAEILELIDGETRGIHQD